MITKAACINKEAKKKNVAGSGIKETALNQFESGVKRHLKFCN